MKGTGIRDLTELKAQGIVHRHVVPKDVVFEESTVTLTEEVVKILEGFYATNQHLTKATEKEIRDHLMSTGLTETQLRTWFHNQNMLKEEESLKGLMRAYADGPPDAVTRKAFLLPSECKAVTTTKISMKVRKGTVYHVVFRYKTKKEIEDELSTGWKDFEDKDFQELCDSDPDKKRGKAVLCFKEYHWQLLLTTYRADHLSIVSALNKKDMLLLIAGETNPKAAKFDLDEPENLKNLPIPGPETPLKICSIVDEKLQKEFEIFSGRGRKLLDDRVFVRDKLREVAQNPTLFCVLKECIVYAPADVLEGLEIVDAPGAGSNDPGEQVCLTYGV